VSLDASLGTLGKFEFGKRASSRAEGQPSRSARSLKVCQSFAKLGRRSSPAAAAAGVRCRR